MWTEERRERAIKFWEAGHSATQIISDIGPPFLTRNAIIGMLHRAGFKRGVPGRGGRPPGKKPRTAHSPARQPLALNPVPVVKQATPVPEPVSRHATLQRVKGCRWADPGEGPNYLFCDNERFESKPYCEHHAGRAYLPPKSRRVGKQ